MNTCIWKKVLTSTILQIDFFLFCKQSSRFAIFYICTSIFSCIYVLYLCNFHINLAFFVDNFICVHKKPYGPVSQNYLRTKIYLNKHVESLYFGPSPRASIIRKLATMHILFYLFCRWCKENNFFRIVFIIKMNMICNIHELLFLF